MRYDAVRLTRTIPLKNARDYEIGRVNSSLNFIYFIGSTGEVDLQRNRRKKVRFYIYL